MTTIGYAWQHLFFHVSVHEVRGDWSIFRPIDLARRRDAVRKYGPVPFFPLTGLGHDAVRRHRAVAGKLHGVGEYLAGAQIDLDLDLVDDRGDLVVVVAAVVDVQLQRGGVSLGHGAMSAVVDLDLERARGIAHARGTLFPAAGVIGGVGRIVAGDGEFPVRDGSHLVAVQVEGAAFAA